MQNNAGPGRSCAGLWQNGATEGKRCLKSNPAFEIKLQMFMFMFSCVVVTSGDTCHDSNSKETIISSWKLAIMWIGVKQICLCVMLLYLILKHTGYVAEVLPTSALNITKERGKSGKTLKKDKFCMFSNSEYAPQRINCSATNFKSLGIISKTRSKNLTNNHH